MLFVNFLKKNAEAGQAFFKKLLLVLYVMFVVFLQQFNQDQLPVCCRKCVDFRINFMCWVIV